VEQLDVEFYRSHRLSFFPLPYGEKQDDKFKWGVYQTRQPTDAEIKAWFGNGSKHNIAVVCGQVSHGLTVLDSDTMGKFYELSDVVCEKRGISDLLDFTRVSQTSKGCHIWLFVNELVKSHKFPQLDIQAEGKYVVAPPSRHPTGIDYQWANLGVDIKRIGSLLDIGIDLSQRKESTPVRQGENWISEALKGVSEGDRNDLCYRLASHFKNTQPIDITESLLLDWNKKNHPPLEEEEVIRTIKSAYGRDPNNGDYKDSSYHICPSDPNSASERDKSVTESVTKPLAELIEEWIKDTSGWFSYEDIDKEFAIKTPQEKDNRRQIIKRLKEAGIIEAHPKNNKLFRHVNIAVRLIDFKTAGQRTPLAVKYPFSIEKHYNTYPGNIIVVAGAVDTGKTAVLLNFIKLNQYDFPIFYQSSEMGKEELASRLLKFEGINLDEWNFTAEERSTDFADVIRPDCINIVDYMELSGDFYHIGGYMRQIHDKLSGGIAIVALQKKRGAELGRGGEFGAEKPRLYLTMDKGKMTIQKAKNWVDPENNPNGLTLNFKIVAGCKLIVTEDWHREGSE
jgi:hypothetical protein